MHPQRVLVSTGIYIADCVRYNLLVALTTNSNEKTPKCQVVLQLGEVCLKEASNSWHDAQMQVCA
jgi:hypothetical protein